MVLEAFDHPRRHPSSRFSTRQHTVLCRRYRPTGRSRGKTLTASGSFWWPPIGRPGLLLCRCTKHTAWPGRSGRVWWPCRKCYRTDSPAIKSNRDRGDWRRERRDWCTGRRSRTPSVGLGPSCPSWSRLLWPGSVCGCWLTALWTTIKRPFKSNHFIGHYSRIVVEN